MNIESKRPLWATRIRQSYVSGETSVFILHLNVFDRILHEGALHDLTHYLAKVLLWENKRNILVYEPSVLKTFAYRYLLEVPRAHPSRVQAYRLLRLLLPFVPIFPDGVPANSVLREFIGGSGFSC